MRCENAAGDDGYHRAIYKGSLLACILFIPTCIIQNIRSFTERGASGLVSLPCGVVIICHHRTPFFRSAGTFLTTVY